MQELIDRQLALEIAMSYCPDDDGCCSKAGQDLREMLDEIESLPVITIENEVSEKCANLVYCTESIPNKNGKFLVQLDNGGWDILEYDVELGQFGYTDEYKDEFGYNIVEWYDNEHVTRWMLLSENL